MGKYRNLKLNPNKFKNNMIFLRCLYEDYEKINDAFNSIFVTARLFDYKIIVSRNLHLNHIFIYFDRSDYWIRIKIFHEHYKIIGINIEKKIKISPRWETKQSFYHHNEFSCKGEKLQEELLKEIFNFL